MNKAPKKAAANVDTAERQMLVVIDSIEQRLRSEAARYDGVSGILELAARIKTFPINQALEQLAKARRELENDNLLAAAFLARRAQAVFEISRINEHNVTPIMAHAETGRAFKKGRKHGAGGPIRKAIARLLKKDRDMTNLALWGALSDNPPKNWELTENRLGKYATGPAGANMDYPRFRNVASEERKKLKG